MFSNYGYRQAAFGRVGKQIMNPYRLINASELLKLQNYFNQKIHHWNELYCMSPLDVHLTLPPKDYRVMDSNLVHVNDKPLAFVEKHYLIIIKKALFDTLGSCFDSISHELSINLFNHLFDMKQCQISPTIQKPAEWFYAGSTCLLLTLKGTHENKLSHGCTIALNPDWVYQQLPQKETHSHSLDNFQEALTEQTVNLNVELMPSTLSFANITGLQVGDVLATDHPLSLGLRLTCGQKLLAQADLGQSLHYKSIILKRPL